MFLAWSFPNSWLNMLFILNLQLNLANSLYLRLQFFNFSSIQLLAWFHLILNYLNSMILRHIAFDNFNLFHWIHCAQIIRIINCVFWFRNWDFFKIWTNVFVFWFWAVLLLLLFVSIRKLRADHHWLVGIFEIVALLILIEFKTFKISRHIWIDQTLSFHTIKDNLILYFLFWIFKKVYLNIWIYLEIVVWINLKNNI